MLKMLIKHLGRWRDCKLALDEGMSKVIMNFLDDKQDLAMETKNGYKYTAQAGYTINYNGYRARLLTEDDIIEVLGCKKYGNLCFSPDEAFEVGNGINSLGFLSYNLTGTNGYWTAIALPNSGIYAWSIQNNIVKPTLLSDCATSSTNTIGVRPVIIAKKADISR